MPQKSLLEVQFPIGPLSLESYKERDAKGSKALSSLGKWWGSKPLVLTRAIILAAVFPAADDPERWPDDLEIFLKCMCLDNAGMWRRKTAALPANLCYPLATHKEREALFADEENWNRRGLDRWLKESLERRAFYTLGHTQQREYCCRVEEIDGPSKESWSEINNYLGTTATSLADLVQQLSKRCFGTRLKVGDAFCGMGSIPFEAAELGCDVYASDLNPVACLLTWGALNIIGGSDKFRKQVHAEQKRVYEEVDAWLCEHGLEFSEEGWRAEAYLYCVEMEVPEWDGWRIPICPSWVIAPKTKTWVELVPIETEKRFGFRVHNGGEGYAHAEKGTKQGADLVCPTPLWNIFKRDDHHIQTPRSISYNQLIENAGGLRRWENCDFKPRHDDVLQERLYCVRWRKPGLEDDQGRVRRGEMVYREPRSYDLDVETRVEDLLLEVFAEWQETGWIPNWRIEQGEKTYELIRTRGWTHWHHLFTPRQLLMAGKYSLRIAACESSIRAALMLNLGRILDANARLCRWLGTQGGGIGGTKTVFYNQALNTFPNYAGRGLSGLVAQLRSQHDGHACNVDKSVVLADARNADQNCYLWITDPPYADAVNYEELSEFFLAWYVPHLEAVFPEWYTDSMRTRAVKGNDAPFRVAMAECYRRLAEKTPDDGLHVLMFTHKSTDVWEDLALIMWAAGFQVKQVWSVATETAALGIKQGGHYVQATYNMVLRKRTGNRIGFVEFITPQLNSRVTEVITRMRESQIEGWHARCGYTDTDYLLAAQAAAAEVVTGYTSIEGVDLESELRTPNAERGRSALRILMENAKRTATDFLVPPAMDRAIKKNGAVDTYQFWRDFAAEEKFILKGLEMEQQGMYKIGAFQDLGRAYGLSAYEELLGPVRANDTRIRIPEEMDRPDGVRFDDVPSAERGNWRYSLLRQIYHSLKLLHERADMDRAVKHLVDCSDFWNVRTNRLAVILAYLTEVTSNLEHWSDYHSHLVALSISVENWKA